MMQANRDSIMKAETWLAKLLWCRLSNGSALHASFIKQRFILPS